MVRETVKIQNIFNKIRSKKEFKDSIYNIKLIEGEEGKVLNEKGDIVLIAAYRKGALKLDFKCIKLFSGKVVL